MVSHAVVLSGLIQLKSIPWTEYIVLPYNIRMPALWTPFRGWILSCQKWTIQDNAYTTSNKSFSIQKLTLQVEGRAQCVKIFLVGADGIAVWDPIDGCPECHPWLKVGVHEIALWPLCSPKVANHDLIPLPCFRGHFRLSFFPCNLGKDALF